MAVSANSVLGKYRILREIARSNDIVYEGVDPAMGRRVAIKELALPPQMASSQRRERIERFYREAKAAGTLAHPNIVTIYDVGQENDRHFIVMEYLEGHSLRQIQQMQGALPLKETLEIALQLCDALGYAHSRGIVHRDVKPDNVHILPGGVIKLTDFGIARITAEPSITAHGQVFGTPSYMSPEQVASHTVDHRTDIFSLGITLYEMVTGRKPFVGDSVITITYNIMNVQPAMPTGVPQSLHTILQRALAKDANMRYQTAAAMAADLRAEKFALESGTTNTRPAQGPAQNAVSGGARTLDTGSVPAEVSGIPAFTNTGGQIRPGAHPQNPPASPVQQGNQMPVTMANNPYATLYPDRTDNNQGAPPRVKGAGMTGWIILIVALIVMLLICVYMLGTKNAAPPGHASADQLNKAATVALNQGNYAAAAQSYQQAVQVAPGSEEARTAANGLSSIAMMNANKDTASNNPVKAAEEYQKATTYDPRNAAAFDKLGNIQAQQGKQQEALESWQSAMNADRAGSAGRDAREHLSSAYLSMGQAAATDGNLEEARRDWQQVIESDPGSGAALQAQNFITRSATNGDVAQLVPTSTPITTTVAEEPH